MASNKERFSIALTTRRLARLAYDKVRAGQAVTTAWAADVVSASPFLAKIAAVVVPGYRLAKSTLLNNKVLFAAAALTSPGAVAMAKKGLSYLRKLAMKVMGLWIRTEEKIRVGDSASVIDRLRNKIASGMRGVSRGIFKVAFKGQAIIARVSDFYNAHASISTSVDIFRFVLGFVTGFKVESQLRAARSAGATTPIYITAMIMSGQAMALFTRLFKLNMNPSVVTSLKALYTKKADTGEAAKDEDTFDVLAAKIMDDLNAPAGTPAEVKENKAANRSQRRAAQRGKGQPADPATVRV